jgi:hypothetical protein
MVGLGLSLFPVTPQVQHQQFPIRPKASTIALIADHP